MRTRISRQRGRKRSRVTPVLTTASPSQPPYPRGNPLTDWVAMTDAMGTCWLAYVEPAPPEKPLRRSGALLPGRRLRFDSLDTSLIVSPIPAGAPYLAEGRLLGLLAEARPVPESRRAVEPSVARAGGLRSLDWGASVGAMAGAVSEAVARRWQATAGVRRLCARGMVQVVAPAVLLLVALWEALLARPRARI